MAILVTGGTGFIGSHTAVELIGAGEELLIVDNFVNSKPIVLDRIYEITGKRPAFVELDLTDAEGVNRLFDEHPEIESCIHFAGLKAVAESCQLPLTYYANNLESTVNLLRAMLDHHVTRLVFSSSATVYGLPERIPIREDDKVGPTTNPYGETKLMIERILRDTAKANPELSISILRYFNPVGAHPSGLIGEDPNGIPNNLFPYVTKVAMGKLPLLHVTGYDYDTPDGTGVRDYIHVCDLARAHLCALRRARQVTGVETYNIGTGTGYSVLDVVHNFIKATGLDVPYELCPRRPGDIATSYADPTRANTVLGWHAQHTLEEMCRDAANWQQKNPDGYDTAAPAI